MTRRQKKQRAGGLGGKGGGEGGVWDEEEEDRCVSGATADDSIPRHPPSFMQLQLQLLSLVAQFAVCGDHGACSRGAAARADQDDDGHESLCKLLLARMLKLKAG
jgi:hypothetical protein